MSLMEDEFRPFDPTKWKMEVSRFWAWEYKLKDGTTVNARNLRDEQVCMIEMRRWVGF
jgi:hypothetical protein